MMKNINVIFITISILLFGYFIKDGLENIPIKQNQVEVKGVSERTVKSDKAKWTITVYSTGDDLGEIRTSIEKGVQNVLTFLKKENFLEKDIKTDRMRSTFNHWSRHNKQNEKQYKYGFEKKVIVETEDVDHLYKNMTHSDELIEKGVLFISTEEYIFTKFNEIKDVMIGEAIQNARKGALEFSKNSNASIGKILSARQGLFTIMPEDVYVDEHGNRNESDASGSLYKKIRVVNTVNFELK